MVKSRRRFKMPRRPNLLRLAARYGAHLSPILGAFERVVMAEIEPILPVLGAKLDADEPDVLGASIVRIKAKLARLTELDFLSKTLRRVAFDANGSNFRYFQDLIERARSASNKLLGVNPILTEPWLDKTVKSFVAENASLITTLPTEGLADIEQMLYREGRRGLSPSQLREKIVEQFGVTRGRAQVIARDQVSKFNAALTQTRQKNLGITEYTWRTVEDGRVRPDHARLDGKVFKWSEPPVVTTSGKHAGERGHPGEPIQCRCFAEPVILI